MRQPMTAGVLLIALTGCGLPAMEPPPDLVGRQPMVTAVTPAAKAVVGQVDAVTVRFSEPIDPASLHREAFAVVAGADPAASNDAALEGWRDRKLPAMEGTYVVAPDGLEGRFLPTDPPRQGTTYAVIVSTSVRSRDGLPLTQTPGEGATSFVSFFATAKPPEGRATSSEAPGKAGAGEAAADAATPGGAVAKTPDRIVPAELMIAEIYYDAPGSDTNGVLFVELRGTPDADVGGYVLHFVNGDGGVVTESVTLPEGAAIPADGLLVIADGMTGHLTTTQVQEADLVDNFDPQNGPDTVQLVDPTGKLEDVVGYGMPLPLYGENGLPMYEGTPGPDAPAGQSISRRPGAPDTNKNAADFVINTVPSPGKAEVTP